MNQSPRDHLSKEHQPESQTNPLELVHEVIEIEGLHPFYQMAYEAAQNGFKNRINMEEFSNRIDLPKDLKRVREKMFQIKATCIHGTEQEKMAIVQSDIFEHMLHTHIGEAEWFGDSVQSVFPSIYDDLFNGVDLILEQNVGRGAFAFSTLAIDATFSAQGAIQKLERTRDFLAKGNLGGIKYFKSEKADIVGRMDSVPHFIIGLGRPALFSMVSQYVQKGAVKEVNQEARRMVLEQIVTQANYFSKLLTARGFEEKADKYARIESEMTHLLTGLIQTSGAKIPSDEVYQAILGYCAKRGVS